MDIEVGEDVIPLLAELEEAAVDVVRLHLIVEPIEAQNVIFGAAHGVRNRGAGLHDEGPVAGLSQEHLTGRLVKSPAAQRSGIGVALS